MYSYARPALKTAAKGEVTRFWVVNDPMKIDGSYSHYWEDPAIHDEEHRLMQICAGLDEGGYSVDRFVNIYIGMSQGSQWKKTRAKVYVDEASARADAVKRMAAAKKAYEREKG